VTVSCFASRLQSSLLQVAPLDIALRIDVDTVL